MDTPFFQLPEREEDLIKTFILIFRKLLNLSDAPAAPATTAAPAATGKLLDPASAMRLLNISRATLYRLKKAGVLSPTRIGGHDYYLESDIRGFFKS